MRVNKRKELSDEVKHKLYLSRVEAEDLNEREIRCPNCGFLITKVFSDINGHLQIKCEICKSVNILNLAYFRRRKPTTH